MQLKKSRLAEADLAAIVRYGLDTHGVEAALAYLDLIEVRFTQLRDYPELGQAEPALHPKVRSLSCHSHRIFYSIEQDEAIIIRRILHKSADYGRWLA